MRALAEQQSHRFAPDLGPLEHRLIALSGALTSTRSTPEREIRDELSELLATVPSVKDLSHHKLRWAFVLSVLADLASAGVKIGQMDSSMYLAWPNWSAEQGSEVLREALTRLRRREEDELSAPFAMAGFDALPDDMLSEEVLQIVSQCAFRLCAADELHPSGATYQDIFRRAVGYWSMPYRDREGRRARFVLTAESKASNNPLPVALLEVGDGPPYLTLRDEVLGATPSAFLSWIDGFETATERLASLRELQDRLENLRSALLPVESMNARKLTSVYADIPVLERKMVGRSTGAQHLVTAKRAIYLSRLARAHRAVSNISNKKPAESADLYALVRVMRDLILPRTNLEIAICGALPPFSIALVGKLVTGFAADPRIRTIGARPIGAILRSSFNEHRLSPLLPCGGTLLLTTQGLYAEHSAQYQRAEIPGPVGAAAVRFQKLGVTEGMTASLMSRRTNEFATALLASAATASSSSSRSLISREFGSGGSKRQRQIEAALGVIGLPDTTIHPRIRRPLYAATLVSNLRKVFFLNEKPNWLINSAQGPDEYADAAVGYWRTRWLPTVKRRLAAVGNRKLAGVRSLISSNGDRV